ncbi:MAG: hypothetical protein RBS40_15380 [Rhodocyclaceae bacterium]|jgi:hypothetical protein|nr:hypothetical protein [Rhodocyclaceae bacterium]
MKTRQTLIALIATTTALLAGSAMAGPDWSAIERARANKQTQPAKAIPANWQAGPQGSLTLQSHGPRPQYVRLKSTDGLPVAQAPLPR